MLRSSAKAEERGEASNEGSGDGGSSRQENDTGGGSDEAGQAGRGDSGRRAAGRKTLEMRRDVEERVAFLKGLARECDDEVGLLVSSGYTAFDAHGLTGGRCTRPNSRA